MTKGAASPGMTNPLHWEATDPDVLWSPGNVSEAIPGVSSALNWSFIDDAIELAARRAFCSMGVLRRDEIRLNSRAEERFMVCLCGRAGPAPNAVAGQLSGVGRPEAVNNPSYDRIPAVAARMPRAVSRLRAD